MKEFTNKKTGSFGFVVRIFVINGVEWADVICFTARSKRNTTVKVSDIVIE